MTRAQQIVLMIYACDYRILEARRECGCNPDQIRCLLSRGENPRDRNEISMGDCIRCMAARG